MSKSKAKGTAFETQVATYLQGRGLDAERVALSGISDRGDIHIRKPGGRITVIECKAGAQTHNPTPAQERGWFKEAEVEAVNLGPRADVGVAVLKRKGAGKARAGDHDALIDLADLNYLLGLGNRHMAAIVVRIRLSELVGALKVAGY